MSNITSFLSLRMLQHAASGVIGFGATTSPFNTYAALFNGGTELSGGSYARVLVSTGTTPFNSNINGTCGTSPVFPASFIYNNNDIVFPTATSTWTHDEIRLLTAASGGSETARIQLATPLTTLSGQAVKIPSFTSNSAECLEVKLGNTSPTSPTPHPMFWIGATFAQRLLNTCLGKNATPLTPYTPPSAFYIAFFSDANATTELSAGVNGYARSIWDTSSLIGIVNNTTLVGVPSASCWELTHQDPFTLANAPTTGNWNYQSLAIMDSPTVGAGNLLFATKFASVQTQTAGLPINVNSGDIKLQIPYA